MSTNNIVIMVSGNGSNMEAIIKNCNRAYVTGVISDNSQATALKKAIDAGIFNIHAMDKAQYRGSPNPDDMQKHLWAVLCMWDMQRPIQYLVLAGFMTILTEEFLRACWSRSIKVINIHPSLLPKYPGLDTHRKVIENGDVQHGFTIHHVLPEVDAGPIIYQHSFYVNTTDPGILKARCLELENAYYPKIIDQLITGELS